MALAARVCAASLTTLTLRIGEQNGGGETQNGAARISHTSSECSVSTRVQGRKSLKPLKVTSLWLN